MDNDTRVRVQVKADELFRWASWFSWFENAVNELADFIWDLQAKRHAGELKRKQCDIDALLKERDELKHHLAQYQELNGALQRDCAMYITRIDQLIGKDRADQIIPKEQ